MSAPAVVHPHNRYLVLAGALAVFGLALGILYVLWSTPYTMLVFLGPGQLSILAGAAIFLAVVLVDVRERLQSVVEKRYAAGETVFRQGDFPDRLFLIGEGEADVVRQDPGGEEVHLARLKAGEFFGEMGILGDAPRSATVRAASELRTLSIHRGYLRPIFTYLPSWNERVRVAYAERTGVGSTPREAGADAGTDGESPPSG